jgi:hypothetical protein
MTEMGSTERENERAVEADLEEVEVAEMGSTERENERALEADLEEVEVAEAIKELEEGGGGNSGVSRLNIFLTNKNNWSTRIRPVKKRARTFCFFVFLVGQLKDSRPMVQPQRRNPHILPPP